MNFSNSISLEIVVFHASHKENKGERFEKYENFYAAFYLDSGVCIEESFNLYHRIDSKIDVNKGQYSIAIVSNRNMLKDFVEEKYPACRVVLCDSPRDCVKTVEAGKADMAYLDMRVADNVLIETGITDIRQLPMDPVVNGIAIEFSGENSELLASIVNKGIQQLDQSDISDAMVQYALASHEEFSMRTVLRDYPGWVIFALSVLTMMIIGLTIVLTYANVMKKQRDKIARADADKTEFFSRMSHDMRTPMNGILGMIRLPQETSDLTEIQENMDKAEAAGEYMLSLINDTLDLQRLESERLKLEPEIVHTSEYVNNLLDIVRVSTKQKNIDFRITNRNVDEDTYIEIDKVRVKQIFSNLLSNAVKFTPDGGIVEVVMEIVQRQGSILHGKFQIRDTGVGMSKDFMENRLFKPYSQENNVMSSQLAGSGLGMAITKNLVEIMGGKMEVESELGEGTTYTVYLNIKKIPKEKALQLDKEKQESVAAVDIAGMQILLCEDHPLNAEIARRLLQKMGCKVVWVENGRLAIDRLKESEEGFFDIILMDIRMPVMDGITAAKEIRKLDREDAREIPIIAMTANAYESDIRNCLDAGMNEHLPKPVEPQKIYETLMKYVKK